jgi:hypothetical protein
VILGSQHALWFVPGEVQGFEYFVERYALLDELDQVLSGDKLTILCEVRQKMIIFIYFCQLNIIINSFMLDCLFNFAV